MKPSRPKAPRSVCIRLPADVVQLAKQIATARTGASGEFVAISHVLTEAAMPALAELAAAQVRRVA